MLLMHQLSYKLFQTAVRLRHVIFSQTRVQSLIFLSREFLSPSGAFAQVWLPSGHLVGPIGGELQKWKSLWTVLRTPHRNTGALLE